MIVCELCEFTFVSQLFFVNSVLRANPTLWAHRARARHDPIKFFRAVLGPAIRPMG
jgi:hypothetical protein